MARLIKYDNGLLFNGAELVFTASDVGNPDPECCCDTGSGCPPGGLCPCPDGLSNPLFTTGWPGELSPSITIDCEDECPYYGISNGGFACGDGIGYCDWSVTVCAEITCNTIDEDSGCGSECTLANVVVTVDTSLCDCPDELPDQSSFQYFYCP